MNGGQMYLHTHHSLSQQENQPRLGVVGWKNPPAPPTSSLGVRPAGQEENKPSWAATWGRAGGADSQRTWIVPYGTTKHKDLQRPKEDWRSPSLWQTHILIISHQTLHLCSRKFDKILCIYSQNLRKTKLVPQTRRWNTCWTEHRQAKAAGHKIPWNAHQGPGTEENGAKFEFNLIPSGEPGSSLQVSALTQFHIHELLWTSTGKEFLINPNTAECPRHGCLIPDFRQALRNPCKTYFPIKRNPLATCVSSWDSVSPPPPFPTFCLLHLNSAG